MPVPALWSLGNGDPVLYKLIRSEPTGARTGAPVSSVGTPALVTPVGMVFDRREDVHEIRADRGGATG